MFIVLYILGGIVLLLAIIYIVGIILPKERVVSIQSDFDVFPELFYRIVIDNTDWQYRTDLKELIIVERNSEMEIWDEVSKNGSIIRFKTKEKIPYSFYSFTMESNLFTGYWTADFKENSNGGTTFTATEYVRMKNPFTRALSYLLFDLAKFMEIYQTDLKTKIDSIK